MHRKSVLKAAVIALAVAGLATSAAAQQRDYIQIVGSSTVYPFTTVVAEQFGKTTKFKTPKVESTGSGGGLKLFCAGVGVEHPDMTNSSRRIKQSEVTRCDKNGVKEIVELKVGYDGIAVANSKKSKALSHTPRDLFLALAKEVPATADGSKRMPNPYKMWKDVNAKLPAVKIEVLGPPPTSGTRDAFVELVMDAGCKKFSAIKKMSKKPRRAACRTMREDGAFVEAGENDNLIVPEAGCQPQRVWNLRLQFSRPEHGQAPGRVHQRRQAGVRDHRRRQLSGFASAVRLHQEGPSGRDLGHERIPGRVHQREGLGRRRLPVRQGTDPHAQERACAVFFGREKPEEPGSVTSSVMARPASRETSESRLRRERAVAAGLVNPTADGGRRNGKGFPRPWAPQV